ncbi:MULTISPECIES: acyl-CoA dehydrogenase family protein [Streptomyces]|uniref:Acyl-CoA dehydrogenase n=1 Tax=Streptomyces cacaoi TaxID=1898 RepID=A0A4Y3QYU5_STRCI|nr:MULTISPECIES: acyl-CoA dehydrogenase family protein [Streptomyces]NNG89889.1 acyl-CoA/acyl-ACP dehydrogenase [Streptomyces cacaoi]GEB49817.1 acyl-CoA dehydrogenase [Streptomyces cacaoi]
MSEHAAYTDGAGDPSGAAGAGDAGGGGDAVALATRLAEEVLYPRAGEVDTGQRRLTDNLDELARHGLYGGLLPAEAGGLGVDLPTAALLGEILASGCLSTTLTLGQHQGITATVAGQADPELRARWLPGLARGEIRSGAAFTGAIPGPPRLTVRPAPGGYRLDGTAPWVSGWGMVQVLGTAARDADDNIAWLLVDAEEGPTLRTTPQRMLAANASRTVTVEFTGHPVPADRLVTTTTRAEHTAGEPVTKRLNGALVLGVARRAVQLLDEDHWWSELDACRAELDDLSGIDAARAHAGEFAVRAATAAVVQGAGRGILDDATPQRLLREAGLMLVFSSRPAIRDGLLERLRG